MVGKRSISYRGADSNRRNPLNQTDEEEPLLNRRPGDLESHGSYNTNGNNHFNGYTPRRQNGRAKGRPGVFQFQDAARTALADMRREELKKALLHGIDRDALEKYRKTDQDLKCIENKQVRRFYEEQNERLNDWLEVDTVVTAIADDVLESMDPDPDRDGDHEVPGITLSFSLQPWAL
jgi:hypothetical protein